LYTTLCSVVVILFQGTGMNQSMIGSFLTSMFEDRNLFIEINGASSVYNKNYMLVADVLSENIDLFAEVIKEHINSDLNINTLNIDTNSKAVAF